jgi:hypothetical protein
MAQILSLVLSPLQVVVVVVVRRPELLGRLVVLVVDNLAMQDIPQELAYPDKVLLAGKPTAMD